jgi:hypothetical protein
MAMCKAVKNKVKSLESLIRKKIPPAVLLAVILLMLRK